MRLHALGKNIPSNTTKVFINAIVCQWEAYIIDRCITPINPPISTSDISPIIVKEVRGVLKNIDKIPCGYKNVPPTILNTAV